MAVSSELVRDAAERVGVTIALAGVSAIIVNTQGWSDWWVIPLAGILNIVKVLIAQHYGDPSTGGFVDPHRDEQPDDLMDPVLIDTRNGVEYGVIQDVDQDPSIDYGG